MSAQPTSGQWIAELESRVRAAETERDQLAEENTELHDDREREIRRRYQAEADNEFLTNAVGNAEALAESIQERLDELSSDYEKVCSASLSFQYAKDQAEVRFTDIREALANQQAMQPSGTRLTEFGRGAQTVIDALAAAVGVDVHPEPATEQMFSPELLVQRCEHGHMVSHLIDVGPSGFQPITCPGPVVHPTDKEQ